MEVTIQAGSAPLVFTSPGTVTVTAGVGGQFYTIALSGGIGADSYTYGIDSANPVSLDGFAIAENRISHNQSQNPWYDHIDDAISLILFGGDGDQEATHTLRIEVVAAPPAFTSPAIANLTAGIAADPLYDAAMSGGDGQYTFQITYEPNQLSDTHDSAIGGGRIAYNPSTRYLGSFGETGYSMIIVGMSNGDSATITVSVGVKILPIHVQAVRADPIPFHFVGGIAATVRSNISGATLTVIAEKIEYGTNNNSLNYRMTATMTQIDNSKQWEMRIQEERPYEASRDFKFNIIANVGGAAQHTVTVTITSKEATAGDHLSNSSGGGITIYMVGVRGQAGRFLTDDPYNMNNRPMWNTGSSNLANWRTNQVEGEGNIAYEIPYFSRIIAYRADAADTYTLIKIGGHRDDDNIFPNPGDSNIGGGVRYYVPDAGSAFPSDDWVQFSGGLAAHIHREGQWVPDEEGTSVPWRAYGGELMEYKGQMLRIGGVYRDDANQNRIWFSMDGQNWTRSRGQVPYHNNLDTAEERAGISAAALGGTLYILAPRGDSAGATQILRYSDSVSRLRTEGDLSDYFDEVGPGADGFSDNSSSGNYNGLGSQIIAFNDRLFIVSGANDDGERVVYSRHNTDGDIIGWEKRSGATSESHSTETTHGFARAVVYGKRLYLFGGHFPSANALEGSRERSPVGIRGTWERMAPDRQSTVAGRYAPTDIYGADITVLPR